MVKDTFFPLHGLHLHSKFLITHFWVYKQDPPIMHISFQGSISMENDLLNNIFILVS